MQAFSKSQNKIIDVPSAPAGWKPPTEPPKTTGGQGTGATGTYQPGRIIYLNNSAGQLKAVQVGNDGVPIVRDLNKESLNINPVQNIVSNAGDILKGIAQLPSLLYNIGKEQQNMILNGTADQKLLASVPGLNVFATPTGKQALLGMVEDLGKTTGITIDQNGVNFDLGQALTHDWNHPLSTLAWILPFMKVAKGGVVAEAGKAAEAAPAATDVAAAAEKLPGPITGRVLEDIATFPEKGITATDTLVRDATRITTALTRRGMAQQLEAFSTNATEGIKNVLKPLDAKIGLQKFDEVVNDVMSQVENSSVAQANPELLPKVESIVRDQIKTQNFAGTSVEGTTLTAMNDARMYLNRTLKGWFKGDMKVTSPTDALNALKAESSWALKDLLAEADPTNAYLKTSLNLQHAAIAVSGQLSKAVLGGGRGMGQFGFLLKAINLALEPVQISAARALVGPGSQIVQDIAKGAVPAEIAGAGAGEAGAAAADVFKGAGENPPPPPGTPPYVAPGAGPSTGVGKAPVGSTIDMTVGDVAYKQTVKNGGITIDLGGNQPSSGIAFSPYKELQQIVPEAKFTEETVSSYINKNLEKLRQPGNNLGTWDDNGKIYLDVAVVGDYTPATLQKAIDAQQLAAMDLKTFDEIPLGTMKKGVYNATYEAANHPYLAKGQTATAGGAGGGAGVQPVQAGVAGQAPGATTPTGTAPTAGPEPFGGLTAKTIETLRKTAIKNIIAGVSKAQNAALQKLIDAGVLWNKTKVDAFIKAAKAK